MLDGLLLHGSELDISEHYTDTAGATDHVFALSHLLGYRFAPRIRDLADRRLGTFEPAGRYKELEPLIGRPINTAIILECWDEVVRLARVAEGQDGRALSDVEEAFRLQAAETASTSPCRRSGVWSGRCSRSTGWRARRYAADASPG